MIKQRFIYQLTMKGIQRCSSTTLVALRHNDARVSIRRLIPSFKSSFHSSPPPILPPLQPTSPSPSPSPSSSYIPTHVVVIGGGSMGLWHAALLQLRCEYQRNKQESTNQIKSKPSPENQPINPSPSSSSSSVALITAQRDLAHHVSTIGVELGLLCDYVSTEHEWLSNQVGSKEELKEKCMGQSHCNFNTPVQIQAHNSIDALTHALASPPTHVLIMVKGSAAVKRGATEIFHLFRQLHHRDQPLPAVCLLMNGLGHMEMMVNEWKELLQHESSSSTRPIETSELLQLFESRLFVATTTNGAKVEKIFAHDFNSNHVDNHAKLTHVRIRHGGSGVTMVMQNESESKQSTSSTVSNSSSSDALIGSRSLLQLFRSIGFETHLASFHDAPSTLYTKLLVNCVINPLTALHYVPNGKLQSSEFTEFVVHLTQECVTIINRLGIRIADYPVNRQGEEHMWPADIAAYLPQHTSDDLMRALFHVYMTAFRTRHNYSSMGNDLHTFIGPNRRRTTEIESITGFLLKKAKEVGMNSNDFPYNEDVYRRIQLAESLFAEQPHKAKLTSSPISKLASKQQPQ